MLAKEDGVGKRGKCPKCAHVLVVPKTTKGRPAISSNKETIPDQPPKRVPAWDKDKNLRFGPDESAEALTELFKDSFGFLIPTYDKFSLLLMVLTLVLLYLANLQIQGQILGWIRRDWPQELLLSFYPKNDFWKQFYFLFLCFFIVLPFQVFFKRKTDFKKKVILFFVVLINSLTGIIAGIYVLKNTSGFNWLLIFPIWNIVNCVLLLFMLFFNLIDESCISNRDATMGRVIFGLAAVLIIFAFCNFVFQLYWAITFSICIVYTTSFDRALQSVFGPPPDVSG